MLGVIVIRLSMTYILINIMGLGLMGAWIAILFNQIIRWIVITIIYRTGRWKSIKLKLKKGIR